MSLVTASWLDDGQVLRVVLEDPPRNILGRASLRAFEATLKDHTSGPAARRLKAILLTATGPNFSCGASIPEHAPERAPEMLVAFHAATMALARPAVPVLAAVRGHCLGAGLELVALATRIFAHGAARFGQPEVKLGSFAPVASLLLPRRIGQVKAEELLLTGRLLAADEALRLGLVEEVTSEPETAALDWIHTHLLPLSAATLRVTYRAARLGLLYELESRLPVLERIYVEELLATADAREGVSSFMEKRTPVWSDA